VPHEYLGAEVRRAHDLGLVTRAAEVRHEARLLRNRNLKHRQSARTKHPAKLGERTRLVADGVEDVEGEHGVERRVLEGEALDVHLEVDRRVVEIDRDAVDALSSEQRLQRTVGRDLEQRQRRREQFRSPLEDEREQAVALVRATAGAVEAGVGREPLQVNAAARTGDGVAGEHAGSDAAAEPRCEWTKPARHERSHTRPQPVQDEPGHAGRAYRTPVSILIGFVSKPRRPRLLVFNQYYWPGFEATAHLLTELCEALAADYDVTVITGRLHANEDEPDYEGRNGVEIVRVHSTAYDRTPLHRRAANYLTYLGRALRRGLLAKRPDLVLCMTDPPLVGNVALLVARRFRVPLVVISQDVFPEIAVELGRLRNRSLIALLRTLIRFYLRRADRVVAIGETMRRRLETKGARPERLRVIPNWVDTTSIEPAPRENPWAHEQGLDGRFVVMHSGNIGHAQDLDTLIRAAASLRDLERLSVVLVGFGARHADYVELARELDAKNVSFREYQPRERLSQSLSSADIHFVGLARGLAGYVVPSRMYGVLAAGRPVLVAADEDSETAQLVRSVGCGIVIAPGRPDLVAEEIRKAAAGEYDLAEMGRRGRSWVEAEGGREQAIERYRHVLAELL
jgi:colanic acid biosynthesis glycosyl transferase WcaI